MDISMMLLSITQRKVKGSSMKYLTLQLMKLEFHSQGSVIISLFRSFRNHHFLNQRLNQIFHIFAGAKTAFRIFTQMNLYYITKIPNLGRSSLGMDNIGFNSRHFVKWRILRLNAKYLIELKSFSTYFIFI